MSRITKDNVGKGAAFLYVENIGALVSSYVFWLLVSKATTPDIIGIAGALVSAASIITTIVNLGVPISVERFLGRAFGTHSKEDVRHYILSSGLLLIISLTVCTAVILAAKFFVSNLVTLADIDSSLVFLTITLMVSLSLSRLFRGIIIASINTKILAIAMLISTIVKFVLAYLLLLLGLGAIGLTIGIISFSIMESIVLGLDIRKLLGRRLGRALNLSFKSSFRVLLVGGMPSWVPALIGALGSQLGTIVIFGSNGAGQAGVYFLALSIYTGIQTGLGVLFAITYPVLSSMNEGKEKISHRTIKMSLLFSVPLSYSIIFFTDDIMNLFGDLYAGGSLALQIMLLSIFPVALTQGVSNHAYASGNYRHTLFIGITNSMPRAILYFIFVPLMGGAGGAISFSIGSFTGLVLSIIIARRINIQINWKENLLILVTPILISYLLYRLEINYLLSILIAMATSYVLYIKMELMTHEDIHDFLLILPEKIARPAAKVLDRLAKKINRSYEGK